LTKSEWDEIVPSFGDISYCQGGAYAQAAAEAANARSEFVAIMRSRQVVGLANVRIKELKPVKLGIAYAHRAPCIARKGEFANSDFGYCVDCLIAEYTERRNLILRIAPAVDGGQNNQDRVAALQKRGFRRSRLIPTHDTFILDLDHSLLNIRKDLDRKWRNHLSKAERSNIHVTYSEAPIDFDRFKPLLLDLMRTKRFAPGRDIGFFRRVQTEAEQYERITVCLAWHNGAPVAGALISFAGSAAVYLLGASNPDGRVLRASFLLQWTVIKNAKALGKRFYDLGGVNEQANPGVYRFKKGLGGRFVNDPGLYDFAPGQMYEKRATKSMQFGIEPTPFDRLGFS
jgi:lipid II:glycine glycyltransferase (peptidoglycan interpeptide bridge formation enzyme)